MSHARTSRFPPYEDSSALPLTPLRPRCSPSTAAGTRCAPPRLELLVVLRHRGDADARARAGVEVVEVRLREHADDLPHPVGAVVEADHLIAVAHRRERPVRAVHD